MIIDIHGLVIELHSDSYELLTSVVRPFKYFITDSGEPEFSISIKKTDPPYEDFPQSTARFSTPRNIVFKKGDLKVIDYFGKGVVLEENKGKKFTFYSKNINFHQEASYLLVLSLFGQFCDDKGLLRIHALTFSYNNIAFIFSAQSGGGKSTMAFSLLEKDNFKLISDDEAIVTGNGSVLPFPLRIGTLDRSKLKSIPSEYIYEIDRMEFGKKYFVDINFWNDKLEQRYLNKKVYFIAKRLINGEPYIEKASRRKTFSNLLGSAVIGFGLYQGMEFVFNSSPQEIFSRLPVFIKRLASALKFSFGTDSYQIYLSRDSSKNFHVFEEFIANISR